MTEPPESGAMIFGQRMHRLDGHTWLITRAELDAAYVGYVFSDPTILPAVIRAANEWMPRGSIITGWIHDDVLYISDNGTFMPNEGGNGEQIGVERRETARTCPREERS